MKTEGMTDRAFLVWLHERLELVHHDDKLMDFMHRLRAIIASTPHDYRSPDSCTNNLQELISISFKPARKWWEFWK